VLFDFGGTLAECPAWMDLELDGLVSAALAGLAARGWPVPREVDQDRGRRMLHRLRQVARETWMECPARRCVEEILPRLGVECPPPVLLDGVLEDIYGELLPQVTWLPGSLELLGDLAEAGLALGLVSNAAHAPFIHRALAEARVGHLFRTVVISAETGWRKPHPAPFLRALGDLGASPEEAFHVGDHFHQDVVGAARLGIRPIWVNPQAGDGLHTPQLPTAGCCPGVALVRDLAGVAGYLVGTAQGEWSRSMATSVRSVVVRTGGRARMR